MRTHEIFRPDWSRFLNNLSRRQEGWEVTLEVFGPEIGDQVAQRHMFLSGITAEVRDTGDRIEIMMGRKPGEHLTHTITDPTRIDLQQTDRGVDAALRIKSADGVTALLHLS